MASQFLKSRSSFMVKSFLEAGQIPFTNQSNSSPTPPHSFESRSNSPVEACPTSSRTGQIPSQKSAPETGQIHPRNRSKNQANCPKRIASKKPSPPYILGTHTQTDATLQGKPKHSTSQSNKHGTQKGPPKGASFRKDGLLDPC